MTDLSELRREYVAAGLDETDLAADPMAMLDRWMADAVAAGLHEPNAMVVATAAQGVPSARLVLLKAYDERGLCFYTNYASRKAEDLAGNPACALLLPWHELGRQVRVEGAAERMGTEESAAYFATRPRPSQIGAWASPQSQVVASREWLDERYAAEAERFGTTGDVPLPPHWGGFRVVPASVEFWQGRQGRMHDRLRYRRVATGAAAGETATGWVVERLAP